MGKDVIIACDFPSAKQTLNFLDNFKGAKPFVKIGMELFYAEGPAIVKEIKQRGMKVFLDLKLHDIPNTVGSAMKVLAGLGVDMTNVHAAGGTAMMAAALEGLQRPDRMHTILLAVTQLTSTGEDMMRRELLINKPLAEVVAAYAGNAKGAGLDGVVCSPLEAGLIHDRHGAGFLTVTPGIRFADSERGDQSRVTTPEMAKKLGSDYIVVGRPVTRAENPLAAYERCMADFIG